MISRRDQLLLKPWEKRKYENHCRKVQSASPAIDVGPPASRQHVACKLKKQQRESERCDEIEKNNLRLLQSLRNIMTTSRVDNTWTTAQPNFLNRVKLFDTHEHKILDLAYDGLLEYEDKSRRGRCSACTPKMTKQISIPEERVPWAPMKPPVSRTRSKSLPSTRPRTVEVPVLSVKPKTVTKPKVKKPHRVHKVTESSQSIILKRGDLQLALNFPLDTQVKLCDGHTEKFIFRDSCQCKAIKSI